MIRIRAIITIRKVIVMSDIKEEAFIRISSSRLPKAVKSIELLGNLSNRGNYRYSDDQAKGLIRELEEAIDSLAKSFKIDQGAQNKPAAEAISAADPVIEDPDLLKPLARSWVAWSLDKLQHGDRSEAIEMLKIGLMHQRSS